MPRIIDPDDIAYIFKNVVDHKTGESKGYTIGFKPPHFAPKGTRIRKEIVTDEIGDSLSKILEERAKREYGGQLVTPKGDPLNEVIRNGIRMDVDDDLKVNIPAQQLDVSTLDDRVKKK